MYEAKMERLEKREAQNVLLQPQQVFLRLFIFIMSHIGLLTSLNLIHKFNGRTSVRFRKIQLT
jgi:hypothetical protein